MATTATPDYYKTLGVSRTASADEIKKAFRKLARTHHPDAGGDEAKFKEINEAYGILSDPEKKTRYDQFGFAGVDPNYAAQQGGGQQGGCRHDDESAGGGPGFAEAEPCACLATVKRGQVEAYDDAGQRAELQDDAAAPAVYHGPQQNQQGDDVDGVQFVHVGYERFGSTKIHRIRDYLCPLYILSRATA